VTRCIRHLLLTAGACALLASSGASIASAMPAAVPGQPPRGHTRLGIGSVDPTVFDQLTGHHHDVWLQFAMLGGSWVRWNGIARDINQAAQQDRIALITLSATRESDRAELSPQALATGVDDDVFISYSRQANASGRVVWFRPMQEMNASFMSYCAFNANGTRRPAAYSAWNYRRAYRRIAIILRGGTSAQIDAGLAAAALRPLQATLADPGIPRSGKVAMVWNPQGAGTPNVRGNQPSNYYPGRGYVDYVADDLYEQGGHAYWRGMQPLYNYGKPFILGEWAPWGNDDPRFVSQVLTWVKTHPRTAALVYYQFSSPNFQLQAKPQSLRMYRWLARRAVFQTTP
jgi:hypothetical protein